MTRKKLSRLEEALLETAEGMHRVGIMSDADYRKITIRHLGPQVPDTAKPISAEEIRALRERANLSQAAFARYLNLTPGYISQLERGVKEPKGAALTLLNVIRRKGLEVVLSPSAFRANSHSAGNRGNPGRHGPAADATRTRHGPFR